MTQDKIAMSKLSEDVQLLPCPFCNHTEISVEMSGRDYGVRCSACNALCAPSQSEADAIHWWNTCPYLDRIRALEAEPSQEVIKKALDADCHCEMCVKIAIKTWQQQAGGE